MMDRTVYILNIRLFGGLKQWLLDELEERLTYKGGGKMAWITTPNPEQVVQASEDQEFMRVLNAADYAVTDGVGLVWAKQMLAWRDPELRKKHLERISGVELAEELINQCAIKGLRVMIVGGRLNEVEQSTMSNFQFTNKLQLTKSKIKIRYSGGVKNIRKESVGERKKVLEEIAEFKPALLLVAYGAPWQEKWIYHNRKELEKAGVRLAMVVGGAVDYWAGKVNRAPQVVRLIGFEWLWRLVHEPWRWRRQMRLFRFFWLVTRQTFIS